MITSDPFTVLEQVDREGHLAKDEIALVWISSCEKAWKSRRIQLITIPFYFEMPSIKRAEGMNLSKSVHSIDHNIETSIVTW